MVLYQTRLGRHRIVVGYEANHKEFKADPKDEEGKLYPYPVISAHPVHEEAPLFHKIKNDWTDHELKMIVEKLAERFMDQKKSLAWITNFFAESALDPEELKRLEELEYKSKELKELGDVISDPADIKPPIEQPTITKKMNKTDLLTYLAGHQVFSYSMENSHEDLLNAAVSLNEQIIADAAAAE